MDAATRIERERKKARRAQGEISASPSQHKLSSEDDGLLAAWECALGHHLLEPVSIVVDVDDTPEMVAAESKEREASFQLQDDTENAAPASNGKILEEFGEAPISSVCSNTSDPTSSSNTTGSGSSSSPQSSGAARDSGGSYYSTARESSGYSRTLKSDEPSEGCGSLEEGKQSTSAMTLRERLLSREAFVVKKKTPQVRWILNRLQAVLVPSLLKQKKTSMEIGAGASSSSSSVSSSLPLSSCSSSSSSSSVSSSLSLGSSSSVSSSAPSSASRLLSSSSPSSSPPQSPQLRIVDLCGGRGGLALAVSRTFPQCQIVCLDASKPAVEAGNRAAKQLSRANLAFFQGYLPIPPSDLTSMLGGPPDILLGLHACGGLSDCILELAKSFQCAFLVVPCCATKFAALCPPDPVLSLTSSPPSVAPPGVSLGAEGSSRVEGEGMAYSFTSSATTVSSSPPLSSSESSYAVLEHPPTSGDASPPPLTSASGHTHPGSSSNDEGQSSAGSAPSPVASPATTQPSPSALLLQHSLKRSFPPPPTSLASSFSSIRRLAESQNASISGRAMRIINSHRLRMLQPRHRIIYESFDSQFSSRNHALQGIPALIGEDGSGSGVAL